MNAGSGSSQPISIRCFCRPPRAPATIAHRRMTASSTLRPRRFATEPPLRDLLGPAESRPPTRRSQVRCRSRPWRPIPVIRACAPPARMRYLRRPMPLAPGTRIGHYEVLGPLGAGGMGEVYRARDQRLGRTVAIKSLGEGFAADPERVARFEREARILASLHHANIATIYGLEESGGTPYLALEFVEGETLADRLVRGAVTVAETLDFGAQVASALDAAHEQGVVHRDLKPGNVMLTPAGVVKVLDFGLAKNAPSGTDPAPSQSFVPTLTMGATAAGVILGTAPYMSPEQARGKAVDRRTDVWALGCVLYECLTGRRTFEGETTSDVIARILEREPDYDALPASVPQRLRDLVRRCLTKSVADRPRDAGDLRRELQSIATDQSSPRATAERAAGSTPSVAVLYFENLGQDPENDYFCAGIT